MRAVEGAFERDGELLQTRLQAASQVGEMSIVDPWNRCSTRRLQRARRRRGMGITEARGQPDEEPGRGILQAKRKPRDSAPTLSTAVLLPNDARHISRHHSMVSPVGRLRPLPGSSARDGASGTGAHKATVSMDALRAILCGRGREGTPHPKP
jgi:hypothetical protein